MSSPGNLDKSKGLLQSMLKEFIKKDAGLDGEGQLTPITELPLVVCEKIQHIIADSTRITELN